MYIHIDCNNFFVSCELISHPELNGTPVVVANNNENNGGIILALNKEAKAAGLKRGNPIFQVSELIKAKKVTVIDVHHNLYHQISHQIMDVVRKTEMVLGFVQYSVDEFFGEMPDDDPTRLRKYLQQLKDIISQEAHIPVSCGAGTTYNASNPRDKTYAHIDGGQSNPGYFTGKVVIWLYSTTTVIQLMDNSQLLLLQQVVHQQIIKLLVQ